MKTSPGWLWQASRPPHQVGSDRLRDHYKSTKPEWLHWICVGNTSLLGLCTPVKIPKGSDARKMPYFVRKYISHTAAGLAGLEPHVKNKAKWHAIWASQPDDRIHELSSLGAFSGTNWVRRAQACLTAVSNCLSRLLSAKSLPPRWLRLISR